MFRAVLAAAVAASACTAPPMSLPALDPAVPANDCSFVAIDVSSYSVWRFEYRLQVRADGTALLEGCGWDDHIAPHARWRLPRRVGQVDPRKLSELCALVEQAAIRGLDERYTDKDVDDAGEWLVVLRFPDAVKWVYEYGDSAPDELNRLQALLDTLFSEVSWERWRGSDATWFRRSGWPPLEAWLRRLPAAYPPMWGG
jgi:hypothetical protein